MKAKKKIYQIRLLVTLAGVLLCLLFFTLAYASSVDDLKDLKREIEAKNLEIQKLEEQGRVFKESISQTQKESKTLKNQIVVIDKNVQKINAEIKLTDIKIAKTGLEIKVLAQEISGKEEEILGLKWGMAGVLRALYEKDKENYYAMLIKNSTISAFLSRYHEFSSLQNKFKGYLTELKLLKKELELKKNKEVEKNKELALLFDVLGDKKSLQGSQKMEKSQILNLTKNQEKLYQQLLKKTEAKEEEILKELEELEGKLRVLIDPTSLPLQQKEFFGWPAQGRLSQLYGKTSFAARSDFYKFHNGIDIANVYGTPVAASYAGKVINIGDTDKYCPRGAYGKYILIDHENNLATFYTHLSLIKVGMGDKVEKGQLLGYMGRTGLTTGSHLHFTVYDSRTVEVKQSKVCGPMPYGGSIDPMDYL